VKKFAVSALGTEALQTKEIEAENAEEATEKYREMWDNGDVLALDYEIEHFTVTDQETGKDTILK